VRFAVAFVSSRPALKVYADATQVKSNTLTVQSQEVVSRLDGPLEITTYVNLLGNDAYYGYRKVADWIYSYHCHVRNSRVHQ
jgi:ABC-2 type transport system permease protein